MDLNTVVGSGYFSHDSWHSENVASGHSVLGMTMYDEDKTEP